MSESESEDEETLSEEPKLDIRAKRLHQSLGEYVKSVTNIVDDFSDRASNDRVGRWSSPRPKAIGQNDDSEISQSDAENIVERVSQNWDAYPEYTQCKSSFDVCDIYNKEMGYAIEMGVIDGEDKREKLLKENTLPKFFKRYFIKNGGTEYDEETFNEIYEEFENYLTTNSVTYRSRAVLTEFEMEESKLELDEELQIIQIDSDDLRSEFPTRLHPRYRQRETVYILEETYETNKFEGDQINQALETFENVLLALHLFEGSGDVGYSQPITEPTSLFHESYSRARGQPANEFFNEKCILTDGKIEEFAEFWNTIKSQIISPPEGFRIALDKFSNSFQRTNQNDRLLDLVITLEAMYLKEGENQEMSYRLSQRGALFVGDSRENALKVKESLKNSYNKRSTLVHGGAADISHDEIVELHEFTRNSLATFLKMIESGNNHKQLLKELDEQAIIPDN